MKRGIRTISAVMLITAMALSAMPVSPVRASVATAQEDEYKNDTSVFIANTMSQQLIACLSGSDGETALLEHESDGRGYKSSMVFHFPKERIGKLKDDELRLMVVEALADNPNFCTLNMNDIEIDDSGKATELITLYSVIEADKQAASIRAYKNFLKEIEAVPYDSGKMSDAEILLYFHDKLVQTGNYARDNELSGKPDKKIYVPYTFCDSGDVVYSAYAMALNHLMHDFGFTSYYVGNDSHAWNIVKLNGKWYAIDLTLDDPLKQPKDTVDHGYFLVPGDALPSDHVLNAAYTARFPELGTKYGTDYDSFLPKKADIKKPFSYDKKNWFYADGGQVFRWDGKAAEAAKESEITPDDNRCVNELAGSIYVGGSDGVYVYNTNKKTLGKQESETGVEGFFWRKANLYVRQGNQWQVLLRILDPRSYEEFNGTDDVEKVTLVTPGAPVIKCTKKSTKKVRVKVTTEATDENAGYVIEYANKKSFKKAKTVFIDGLSGTIRGLKEGKKYFIRARGIYEQDYLVKYGESSNVVKMTMTAETPASPTPAPTATPAA